MDLQSYAALAEIFGALTIITGAAFAAVQYTEYRRRARIQSATELCRRFTEPQLARAVSIVRQLPDNVSKQQMEALDPECQEAAQIVGMTFETMGLLVYRDMASFAMIQDLTGGLLLMMWRKIGPWVKEVRETEDNPRFGEWAEWLANRIEECEEDITPAHIAHKDWKKHLNRRH